MIPQKLQKTALGALTIFFLISPLQAFEFFNPFSECNAQQSKIMIIKCEPLSGKAYTECESETLKQFYKCVEGVSNGK